MGICLIIKSGGGVDTSTANATASTIVSGYTCYVNDALVTGSMPKQSLTKTLSAGGSQTIAAGYYTENESKISVSTLASLTGGTDIAASQVLNTYTYWSSGSKGTGTMTNRGAKAWTMSINGSEVKIESGWHDGNGTVKQSPTVTKDTTWRMNTPGTSNKTICNSGWYYTQNQWCEGTTNLAAGNIKKGVSIFGVTGSYYETKRWLIQNGSLTGLVSSDFIGLNNTGTSITKNTTKSYNGSTWLLLCCFEWFSGDDAATTKVFRRFKNVNSIATFGKTSWGCRLHANILTSFTGVKHSWSWSNPRASIIGMWIYDDGTWNGETRHTWACQSDPLDKSGWLSMPNGAVGCGSVTVNTSKMTNQVIWGAAGVSAWWRWLRWTVSAGDYLIDACTNEVNTTDFYWVWAKDLWLETSETTP